MPNQPDGTSRQAESESRGVQMQAAITIIAEVPDDNVARLKALLDKINSNPASNTILPFGEFSQLHFARFVVLEPSVDPTSQRIAGELAFLSDIDGSVELYLTQLVQVAGGGLDQIFGHCVGYPANPSPEARLTYLKERKVKTGAAYVNTTGRTVVKVRREAELRDAIEGFLDRERARLEGSRPVAVREAVRAFIASEASLQWALRPASVPSLLWWTKRLLPLAMLALIGLIALPLLIFLVPAWLITIRLHERQERALDIEPDRTHVRELAEQEDFLAQNQFSAVGFLKPGLVRQVNSTIILWLAGLGIPRLFGRGNLTGVRTIHFARWVFIDGNRRLLFASNYDGSLESYMDDFIDKVAWGLNAVFSNGMDYPKTRWLIFAGAKDEGAFKRYIGVQQVKSQAWYSAYGPLTNLNIANNAAIRSGLSGNMSESASAAWLRRL